MWRIGDKRPIQKSSYGTLGDQSSPGEVRNGNGIRYEVVTLKL